MSSETAPASRCITSDQRLIKRHPFRWLFSVQMHHRVGFSVFWMLLLLIQVCMWHMFPSLHRTICWLAFGFMMVSTGYLLYLPRWLTFPDARHAVCVAFLMILHALFPFFLTSRSTAYIVFGVAVVLIFLDVFHILSRNNFGSLLWIIVKIVGMFCALTWAHMEPVRPWAGLNPILEKISNWLRKPADGFVTQFIGIALSAGAVLVFKDGLAAMNSIAYNSWNVFTNKELRIRKSYAIIISSGYLFFFTFRMWSSENYKLFEGVLVLLSIIVAECVANVPHPSEKSITKFIAVNLLSRCKYPCVWEREKKKVGLALKEVDGQRTVKGKEFAEQIRTFCVLWRRFSKRSDVEHQMLVLQELRKLVFCTVPPNCCDNELKVLMFSAGVICCPYTENAKGLVSHIRVLKAGMDMDTFSEMKTEFLAGMCSVGMRLWRAKKEKEALQTIAGKSDLFERLKHYGKNDNSEIKLLRDVINTRLAYREEYK